MGRVDKTVFVSYRRTNFPWGLAIFQNLTQHGTTEAQHDKLKAT